MSYYEKRNLVLGILVGLVLIGLIVLGFRAVINYDNARYAQFRADCVVAGGQPLGESQCYMPDGNIIYANSYDDPANN